MNTIDEIRESLQLFETEQSDVAHLADIILDLVSEVSRLRYEVDKLKENNDDGRTTDVAGHARVVDMPPV